MKKEINMENVRELVLYATNDGTIYRTQATSIINNLARKMKHGTYDHTKAEKAWEYMVETAAKKYHKEFCDNRTPWHTTFSKNERVAAAKELADYYLEEIEWIVEESSSTVAAV